MLQRRKPDPLVRAVCFQVMVLAAFAAAMFGVMELPARSANASVVVGVTEGPCQQGAVQYTKEFEIFGKWYRITITIPLSPCS